MTTRMIAVIALATACATTDGNPLMTPQSEPPPAGIVDACELASHRCSRCHSLDRILRSRLVEPNDWRNYVHRMRLMPGSAIPPDEESTLVRCLVFRVGGRAGLEKLARETP